MSGQVSKPKIYINYIDYFRAAGLGVEAFPTGVAGTNINEDFSDIFTYNPSNTKSFTPILVDNVTNWENLPRTKLKFKVWLGDGTGEAAKLVQSINFAAYLNHNFRDLDDDWLSVGRLTAAGGEPSGGLGAAQQFDTANGNGFKLLSLNDALWDDVGCFGMVFLAQFVTWDTERPFKLGSVLAGRTFSFPHNANLSLNIDYNTDIKKSRTLGGRDVVNINYYKQPDWDGLPPFVSTYANNLTPHVGRRSWALTFSYLQKENTLPSDMGENFMFDNEFDDNGETTAWGQHENSNLTSHFMTLTMNGQLPFLFQPDDQVATFAMCRLRSNSFSVTQSAPSLYTAKMTFDETW